MIKYSLANSHCDKEVILKIVDDITVWKIISNDYKNMKSVNLWITDKNKLMGFTEISHLSVAS